MDPLGDWIKDSLKDIKHEKFKDVVNVDVEIKPMADGQVVIISDINRATLTLKLSDGTRRYLNVVIKVEPSTGPGKALADEYEVFETENMMYTDILKSMENIMLEKGDTDFLWADCYHSNNNKFVFQDLCEVGYKVVPTYKFLDYDHTILVMKGIGKFHALSLVMNERNLLDKSKLKPNFFSKKSPFLINLHKMYALGLAAKIEENWGPEWNDAAKNLKKLVTNAGEEMAEMCESVKGKWCVLNHGDFSIRNMLFHYPPDSDKPDRIKFVDFQLCNYSNFAFDLASLLYSSLRPQVREDNKDIFLKTYLESYRDTCLSHNYRGPLPTMEDAKSSLKALYYSTTTNSICAIPFMLASGKKDVQKKADDCMEAFVGEQVSDEFHTQQEDIFFTDDEVIMEMKYEVKRMMDENII